jgi:hypothetical protein
MSKNNNELKSAGFIANEPLPKDETETAPVGTPIYQAQKAEALRLNTILAQKISAAKKYARPSELEALKIFEDGISDALGKLEYGRLPIIERQFVEQYESDQANKRDKFLDKNGEQRLREYRAEQAAKK